MVKRFIGAGVTDSNGVATCNYTGSGVGEIDFVAEVGEVVSEPYTILDTVFYDKGHSGTDGVDYNSTGWSNARLTLTRIDDYTQLVWTGSSNNGAYYRDFTLGNGLCIEFDLNFKKATSSSEIVSIDNNWAILGKVDKNGTNLTEDTWHHIKIEMQGATGSIKNNTNDTVVSFDCTGANRLIFGCNNANDIIKYKNFCIYPI